MCLIDLLHLPSKQKLRVNAETDIGRRVNRIQVVRNGYIWFIGVHQTIVCSLLLITDVDRLFVQLVLFISTIYYFSAIFCVATVAQHV